MMSTAISNFTSTPIPRNSGWGSNIYWEQKQTFQETCSNPTRQCSPFCTMSGTLKGHSTTFQVTCLRFVENMVRTSEFHRHGSIAFCYTVRSLLRNEHVWSTMMDNEAFCKFTNGSFSTRIAYRAGKFIFIICISGKSNTVLSVMEEMEFILSVTWGWGLTIGFHCWQTGHSAADIAKSVLVSGRCILWVQAEPPSLESTGWQRCLGKEVGWIIKSFCELIMSDPFNAHFLHWRSHLDEYSHGIHCLHVF